MERLQKILAQAGIASRRKCEELITSGRVTIDGVVCTELGTKVDPKTQKIAVDGEEVQPERRICLILHKPTSYVTTVTDPEGRRTVMDLLEEVKERVYPVGRLDYDSSGLLLLSNDGELTNRLLHPSFILDKVYRVTVLGMPENEALKQLRDGIKLEDGVTQPAEVTTLRKHPLESVFEITIHEGKNRQVRRMFEAIDYPVKRLKRVQFGPLLLGKLAPGEWRVLDPQEWKLLYQTVELTAPPYPFELKEDKKPQRRYDEKKTARGKRGTDGTQSSREDSKSFRHGRESRYTTGSRGSKTSQGGRPARDSKSSKRGHAARHQNSRSVNKGRSK